MEPKKLYRVHNDRIIAGIAAGFGKYFNVDPVMFRVLFVLLAFMTGGVFILIYIILAFVIPSEPVS